MSPNLKARSGSGMPQVAVVRKNLKSHNALYKIIPRLLPKKNFKEPTRPKAEKLGAQNVKCLLQKILAPRAF